MNSDVIVGQILDGKYSIENQLGKGGMGTVYLSTHIGTGRPVAVKIIAPDFMKRPEFVERFRREAKAAGRLRHPNVVDVTDFGFAQTINGEDVAYLVMEYLDGCTLGEVLDEEKKLPVEFSVNILEQVCSAVEEAHKQGIIHRDLKPDNIWLEPNQRGGYTVKVLDFGIAKLEETQIFEINHEIKQPTSDNLQTGLNFQNQTFADESQSETLVDKKNLTIISENQTMALVEESKTLISDIKEDGTMIQEFGNNVNLEDGTAILPINQTRITDEEDTKGTKIIDENIESKGTRVISDIKETDKSLLKSSSTTNLTRVGAVLGTPLYMSPEQCRGEKLTPRSDIYSLAVICYQMLSGELPFSGDYVKVMDGHKNQEPPPLTVKKVPKKLKGIVMQTLSKNLEERPETAEAFASKLRSNSEGIGALLRKSLIIYSQNFPKIFQVTVLAFLPLVLFAFAKMGFGIVEGFDFIDTNNIRPYILVLFEIIHLLLSIVCSAILVGMMTFITAQYLAFPLRPISVRSAFLEVKKKIKSLSFAVGISTIISFIGFMLFFVPGLILSGLFMLIAPSIMMENVKGKNAFKRSIELTRRSFSTVFATSVLIYGIPFLIGISIALFIGLANLAFFQSLKVANLNKEIIQMKKEGVNPQPNFEDEDKYKININIDNEGKIINDKKENLSEDDKKMAKNMRMFNSLTQGFSQLFIIFSIILLASLTSVITALLYFKTRQAGGESMQELLGKLDDVEQPQSKWQQRVRERLIQSGKITDHTTNPSKP